MIATRSDSRHSTSNGEEGGVRHNPVFYYNIIIIVVVIKKRYDDDDADDISVALIIHTAKTGDAIAFT